MISETKRAKGKGQAYGRGEKKMRGYLWQIGKPWTHWDICNGRAGRNCMEKVGEDQIGRREGERIHRLI